MGIFDIFKKKRVKCSWEFSETQPSSYGSSPKIYQTENPVRESVEKDGPPPLAELLKTATQSKQGLYPHEILMLEYAPRFKTANNSFQQFWYYQYSITEPQSVLDSLRERGFIDIGDLRTALEKLKLPEIKEELKLLNQKITGKKSELIDRLIENGDIDSLDKKYSERYYVLTAKGELELKENQYVSYLHRHPHMTVWEMNQRIAKTHYPYRDILWGYFNEQSCIYFQNFEFGCYRNIRMNMFQFLLEENKIKTAFSMLCEVLAYDLSGLDNNEKEMFEWERNNPVFYLRMYDIKMKAFFPYEENSLISPASVSKLFAEMQTKLEMDDIGLKSAILDELEKVEPPRKLFDNNECADIVIAYIHNDSDTLTSIYKKAEKKEKARLHKIKSSSK